MSSLPTVAPPPSKPEAPLQSVQPGGGWCVKLELAWGRFRRWWLRRFHKDYVARLTAKRRGQCEACPGQTQGCRHDVIDPRDLKFFRNVCGYHFDSADDPFRWREDLGLARPGLGEVVIITLAAVFLGIALSIAGAAGMPHFLAATLGAGVFGLWAFLVLFFRDPKRTIPSDPALLVSPADGKITDIGEIDDPTFVSGKALRISIFLSVLNVHVNRAPRAARVTGLRYFPGKYLNAMRALSAIENEQLWIDFEDSATGQPLRVKQIAGAIARRIVCHLRPGDQVSAGERFGMIKVGSRTEVFLPATLVGEVLVKIGQTVRGGSSALLRIKS